MRPIEYETMIFGCGNVIMGDDGFGPAVIDTLHDRYSLPENIQAVDVGTCVREYLFDYLLLDEGRPKTIIICDAVDFPDRRPGEVFEILPDQIPAKIFPCINSPPSTSCRNSLCTPVSRS